MIERKCAEDTKEGRYVHMGCMGRCMCSADGMALPADPHSSSLSVRRRRIWIPLSLDFESSYYFPWFCIHPADVST